jgi:hypothetical protein
MLASIQREEEINENQLDETVKYGRPHVYNTWSINLGLEEIGWIVESGGIIGVSMEQNNLGVRFGKKVKKPSSTYSVHLVFNQIMDMAKAAKSQAFWDCICLGTDFDGVIDPVDSYSSALFFHKLKKELREQFINLQDEEKREAHCESANIDVLLNKLCFDNSFEFLKRHFDVAHMPIVQPIAKP